MSCSIILQTDINNKTTFSQFIMFDLKRNKTKYLLKETTESCFNCGRKKISYISLIRENALKK